jgi:alpha-ketoglutaric semialdehyde dehydrogenase
MAAKVDVKHFLNFINGTWVESNSGTVENSYNPADYRVMIGKVQNSTIKDLNQAVQAAKAAKSTWKKVGAVARGNLLYKVANIMENNLDDIAETMTLEMGKTLQEARGETARGIAILRYFAGEGMRKNGDVIPSTDSEALMFTTRTPLGVVGVITPWNFPVAIPIWKIAPALIYGNTVVFKPATEAAVTAAKVIGCFSQAGFPNGVINFLTGSGSVIGQGIIDHKDVNGITFTGSESTGKLVGQGAVARGAKFQIEMGGKNPVIVTEDADLDNAVDATISGGLRSTGQKCTATSRVIVHISIYEEFKKRLVEKVKSIKIGSGIDDRSWMGPCASENQLKTVKRYIEQGKSEGATLLYGGESPKGIEYENGFYIQPTIFDNVTSDMVVAQEEIFGPVLALLKYQKLEQAIEIANDSAYGLSASIFTKNISKMLTFIEEMDAGLIRINAESAGVELQAPFGGMKSSSSGSREQGEAAKEFFTSIKTVFVKGY